MQDFSKENKFQPVVSNYELIVNIPAGDYVFAGNSVGLKAIVAYVAADKAAPVTLLDIGFGIGDLARIVKSDPAIAHWQVDGIDGYHVACCNTELFAKRHYRNIWHGLASDIPADTLRAYDMICLFDVIEHLPATAAKELLAGLLGALGENSRLVLSTPLFFWVQDQMRPDDLEEHQIGVPAQSLLSLAPTMFHIHPDFLVGTFVFGRDSLALIDRFVVAEDAGFDLAAGRAHLQSLGLKADGVLYFT